MKTLSVNFKNCYGIKSLEHPFDFREIKGVPENAYAIYAPNGVMKTSFSKTFGAISSELEPVEERFNRPTTCEILVDGEKVSAESLFVLKSEIDVRHESAAITNVLVNPEKKARYDTLLAEVDHFRTKLIKYLQKAMKLKQADVVPSLLADCKSDDFYQSLLDLESVALERDLSAFPYATIFEPKALEVLSNEEFLAGAREFNLRYQTLFSDSGGLYEKGVFNPNRAETSFSSLYKNGFFEGGHKVHLKGDLAAIDKEQLQTKVNEINARIEKDDALKKIKNSLSKNAQTQGLMDLLEVLSAEDTEYLLNKVLKKNISQFKKELWLFHLQSSDDARIYKEACSTNAAEISQIEMEASKDAPKWSAAVELFNDRFVDMPFKLAIANQKRVALGLEKAVLNFVFEDGESSVSWRREEIKALSQGELRALYLLNFIFEVEDRKNQGRETIFVIDDIADSFDYKNKHAIVQYLKDLTQVPYFYQIILTHNFDFFRTLAERHIAHRERCLMVNKGKESISLVKAEVVGNYFIGKWKNNVLKTDQILCATIPFVRNLIEYTKGTKDPHYISLTSLLHWKSGSQDITVGQYLQIYNDLFSKAEAVDNTDSLINVLIKAAHEICLKPEQDGLNLEDKIVLSISIRLNAEMYMIDRLRILKGIPNYWCEELSQFGYLVGHYTALSPNSGALRTLEKVGITVSSNIHLNSFMYEPILDLSIEHLIQLHQEVCAMGIKKL